MAWGIGNTGTSSDAVHSNPNLLDNWYFPNPINQKGITVDTVFNTAGAYFIDRWILVSGSVTLTAAGLVLNGTIRQKREYALGTDDFTTSVFAVSGTATAEYDDSLKYFDITSEGGTISAAKLELGSRQTLIKEDETLLNDPPPDYGTELAKCQRYMMVFKGGGGTQSLGYGTIGQVANKLTIISIPTPVTMRAVPSITFSGTVYARAATNGTNNPVVSFSPAAITVSVVTSACTLTNDITTGNLYSWFLGPTGEVILDANL